MRILSFREYFRIYSTCGLFHFRKFKSLGNSGYSLRKQDSYMPFQCMFQQKMMTVREIKKKGTYPSWYDGTSPSENTGSPPSERSPDRSSPLDNAGSPPLDNTGSSPLGNTGSQEEQHEQRDSEEVQAADSPEERKLCTIMYCVPLISPYSSKFTCTSKKWGRDAFGGVGFGQSREW